jgi:ribosomal protein L16 Arg81 hydroxylase
MRKVFRLDFQAFIYPLTPEEFFTNYWGKSPLIISRNDPNFYNSILTSKDLDYILSSLNLRYPDFKLIKFGAKFGYEEYTDTTFMRGHLVDGVMNVDKLLGEYQDGATILLQAIQRYWKPAHYFCRSLEKYFNFPCKANVYMTPKNSQGFETHFDTHDVFVMQISGAKHWRIYDSPVILPDETFSYNENDHKPTLVQELDLVAGDLIYLPRGFVHDALTLDKESTHITLGITPITWFKVFEQLLSACRDDPRFRKHIEVGYAERRQSSDAMKAEFSELLDSFVTNADLQKVIETLSDQFISSTKPMLEGQLISLQNLDTVNLQTLVERRPDIIFRMGTEKKLVVLSFWNRKLTFPKHLETAIQYITTNGRFAINDIAGNLHSAEKLMLVRTLVKQGLLKVVT